jgi:A/G-specific adenine glycosylase
LSNKRASRSNFSAAAARPAPGAEIAGRVLDWYDANARPLPWRLGPSPGRGQRPDPYRVWLSEIMLQQTTVALVIPYFAAFMARWPVLGALAKAPLDDVLHAWQGLGYYARARNLHQCARTVMAEHAGHFPESTDELEALPGIGSYTAAAIAAIAFDRPATVVDGNVERVIARLFGVTETLDKAKGKIRLLAAELTPGVRPGDYAQGMMDLGALTCRPQKPACGGCPLGASCVAFEKGLAEELPRRAAKRARPTRRGFAYWAVRPDGAVMLRKRPAKGLLGGMMEVPSGVWLDGETASATADADAPFAADWRALPGTVGHVFTHFRLEVTVMAARLDGPDGIGDGIGDGAVWCLPERLGDHALPTVMKKIAAHALAKTT